MIFKYGCDSFVLSRGFCLGFLRDFVFFVVLLHVVILLLVVGQLVRYVDYFFQWF